MLRRGKPTYDRGGGAFWVCRCDCGTTITTFSQSLRLGAATSCGKCPRIDLTGRRFGRLTVVAPEGFCKSNGAQLWRCECSCGVEKKKLVSTSKLRQRHVRSCGCWAREIPRSGKYNGNYKHGYCTKKWKRTKRSYESMRSRCHSINSTAYEFYGGRGIWVCLRWLEDFGNFVADMGKRPQGKSLDRIDPYKNYTPDNCRWATSKVQANNKRRNHTPPEPAVPDGGPVVGVVYDEVGAF